MLKPYLLAIVAAGAISMTAPFAAAQDTQSQDQPSASATENGGHGHRGMADPAQHTKELTQKLNLTSDQQSKVQEALQSEHTQMESLRQDTSTSREDRHSKMMDIHKATETQIRGLLDAGQQKKWDEMQARRGQWNHQGAPNGDQPAAPPQQ
jgi:protein CpxP